MTSKRPLAVLVTLCAAAVLPAPAQASHAWYINGRAAHWASTTNPAQIDLGDNLADPVWDSQRYVPSWSWSVAPLASGQLAASPFVRVNTRAGGLGSNEVEMYDGLYGRNGWVGQATLTSIDSQGHIRDAMIQLNRSYSLTSSQKHAAINHEVGHTLGLSHQNGTVMCAVLCGIQNPVRHDYDVVSFANAHNDSYNTPTLQLAAPPAVGDTTVRRDGRRALVYVTRLPRGATRVVFRDYVSEKAATAALRD